MTSQEKKEALDTMNHLQLDLQQAYGMPEGGRREAAIRKAKETALRSIEQVSKIIRELGSHDSIN